jgi:glutaredoxin 3
VSQWHGGKGSKRRGKDNDAYRDNWDRIFKRKKMITIYGKPRCTFCDRAKALCEQKGLDYEYKLLDADYTAEELFEMVPDARTFPQIFIDGEPIGGYQQLEVLHG